MDNSGDWSYPVYVEVKILDPVSGTTFADDLAAVIADENSVAIANATFLGVPASSGIFTDGVDAGLEMDEGVLLTTGRFDSWNLGNQSEVDSFTEVDFELSLDGLSSITSAISSPLGTLRYASITTRGPNPTRSPTHRPHTQSRNNS